MPDRRPGRPRHAFDPGILLAIRPLLRRRGLLLTGEADIRSRRELHDALSEELAGHEGDVHLELAGLRCIDVCCSREILAAAQLHPAACVVLHHPPAVLLRIASLVWPETGIDLM